jgi:YfiH family protein
VLRAKEGGSRPGLSGMTSTLITIPAFGTSREGIEHFFGTRDAPLLSAASNGATVDRLSLRSGVPAAVVSVKQVHGTDVLIVDRPVRKDDLGTVGAGPGWDALMTDQPNVLLTIRTADCLPVLIHDPIRRVVAAVHAGWRGAVAGIVPKTLARMAERFGSDLKTVRIGLGPSIGPCCYEIDEPVLERLRISGGDWRKAVQDRAGGKAILDLRVLVHGQAQTRGVPAEAIYPVRLCTFCHPDLFYSYRRQGVVDRTMVSGIILTGAPVQDRRTNRLRRPRR